MSISYNSSTRNFTSGWHSFPRKTSILTLHCTSSVSWQLLVWWCKEPWEQLEYSSFRTIKVNIKLKVFLIPVQPFCVIVDLYLDGLVQERCNSSALEWSYILLALTHWSILYICWYFTHKIFMKMFNTPCYNSCYQYLFNTIPALIFPTHFAKPLIIFLDHPANCSQMNRFISHS